MVSGTTSAITGAAVIMTLGAFGEPGRRQCGVVNLLNGRSRRATKAASQSVWRCAAEARCHDAASSAAMARTSALLASSSRSCETVFMRVQRDFFFADSMTVSIRRSSSAESLPLPPSTSAATALASEPSKNVCTTRFNAERLAFSRGSVGRKT